MKEELVMRICIYCECKFWVLESSKEESCISCEKRENETYPGVF